MSEAARLPLHRRPAFWAGGIFAAFGIISALRMTDAIGSTTGFILMVIAMLQIIPLTRASLAKQRSTGHLSPAIVRYTRRFLLASFGYMLGLGIAVTIADRVDLSEIESFLIALLPVIPVLGMIWTMARYLIEEEDEFLSTFWGFLETFEVVPHIWAWWVFPVWAIGMGLGQCWMALADRRANDGLGDES